MRALEIIYIHLIVRQPACASLKDVHFILLHTYTPLTFKGKYNVLLLDFIGFVQLQLTVVFIIFSP